MTHHKTLGLIICGLLVAVGMPAWFAGCSAGVGSGGAYVSFTVGGKTTTIMLRQGGVFIVQSDTIVRNIADVKPFDQRPTDSPSSGAVHLRSSSVTVRSPDGGGDGEAAPQVLSINGTATLRVLMGPAGAVAPCNDGIDVGTFEITIQNGVVTNVSDDLSLNLSALALVLDNEFALCLEMETDFSAVVEIQGLDLIFGLSDDVPVGFLQACCMDDGSCEDAAPGTCAQSGGASGGPGTACATFDCVGACCKPDNSCAQLTVNECLQAEGEHQGIGVGCDAEVCSELLGGCCFDDAVYCFDQAEADCLAAGGTPVADCDVYPDPCLFACCLPDGTCREGLSVDECEAEGGTASPRGSACEDVSCPAPCPEDGVCATDCAVNDPDCDRCGSEGTCISGCSGPDPDCVGTLSGTVTDASTGWVIAGATVRVDRPTPVATTTSASGTYVLSFPDLPDYFALSASAEGYIPGTVNVEKPGATDTTQVIDFALEPESLGVIVIEAVPDVHHLGDGNFGGTTNSQFQKGSEGETFTGQFQLTAEQLPPAYNWAELKMLAKGVECGHSILLNGLGVTTLSNSPGDGSFGEFTDGFGVSFLQAGANTIAISTDHCSSSGNPDDIDDFEFVDIQIWLSP